MQNIRTSFVVGSSVENNFFVVFFKPVKSKLLKQDVKDK